MPGEGLARDIATAQKLEHGLHDDPSQQAAGNAQIGSTANCQPYMYASCISVASKHEHERGDEASCRDSAYGLCPVAVASDYCLIYLVGQPASRQAHWRWIHP